MYVYTECFPIGTSCDSICWLIAIYSILTVFLPDEAGTGTAGIGGGCPDGRLRIHCVTGRRGAGRYRVFTGCHPQHGAAAVPLGTIHWTGGLVQLLPVLLEISVVVGCRLLQMRPHHRLTRSQSWVLGLTTFFHCRHNLFLGLCTEQCC